MFGGLRVGRSAFTDAIGAPLQPAVAPSIAPNDLEVGRILQEMRTMPNCVDLDAIPLPHAAVKRTADIVGSLALLIALAPLFVFLAALVRLTSRGPVLYISRRVGLCGALFPFFKLRTMEVDADEQLVTLLQANEKDGPIFKIIRDPRVTAVGRFLRRTSLDELPQLINVLRGEMSLVGPRPPIPREVLQYAPEHLQRLRIKPGITCYWQVMGRSNLTFDQWMELDRKYLEEMSVATDLRILLRTPLAVLRGDGAF